MNEHEQANINKLHESQLQANYLMMANLGLNSLTAVIMIINLLRPKLKKPSVAVRLIKNSEIMARVQADRAAILQEAAYEEQRMKLENGLDLTLIKENKSQPEPSKLDLTNLTNLKQAGENFLKDKQNLFSNQVNQVSKVAKEKVQSVTETVGAVSDQLKSVSNEVSDKLKSGVNKVTSLFKKDKKK